LTAVKPPGRYGSIQRSGNLVTQFVEKPQGDGGWINGGFFVLSPKCLDFIDGDVSWEVEPLMQLARINEITAFDHKGFWQPMDTLRDKNLLEDLWNSGKTPWKKWK
jgi:glucose-1-phosphate cytidylyltransferase